MSFSPGRTPAEELALGDALVHARRLREAREAFDEAERLGADPDGCASGRWMVEMLAGEFATAWRESDAIRARGRVDPHRFWDGQPVTGRRVMLRCLHGFGDAVQMLRYLPRLRAIAAEVTVQVPPRLVDLATCFSGMGQVTTWGDAVAQPEPVWDTQVEVMELPYLFRTEVADLPIAAGYVRLSEEERARAEGALGPRERMRVGLVWSAGEWNRTRSIPMERIAGLVTGWSGDSRFEFWSLQGEGANCAAGELYARGFVRDVPYCRRGILELTAVIASMDLVITVDTLAAHLAGALGRPAWVLLQHDADWRWMSAGERSPWYPSLRLLRRGPDEEWAELIERTRQRLHAWP